jgi:membrane-bound ClpP family serine protease
MHRTNKTSPNDQELADFTDRMMQGRIEPTASTSDEELLSLEKTILRLTDAFPPETLDDAKSKQMLVRLKARMRREEQEQASRPSFWKRLFDIQSNPQVALLVTVAAVVMLAIVILPTVGQSSGSVVSGTAFSGTSFFTVATLAAVLLIIYWISRRK